MEKICIVLNSEEIYYSLYRKNVKNVYFKVTSNGELNVSVPKNLDINTINSMVKGKEEWILKSIANIKSRVEASKKMADYIYYLGKKYKLVLVESKKNFIGIDNNNIYINTTDVGDRDLNRDIYLNWLKVKCSEIFDERLDVVYLKFKKYNVKKPEISIRNMKTRWGSCRVNKSIISLNVHLGKAPIECIDYVIYHELTHFLHPNHGEGFYRFLEHVLPEWESRKKILNSLTNNYMFDM